MIVIIGGKIVNQPGDPTTPTTPPASGYAGSVAEERFGAQTVGLTLTGQDGSTWDLAAGPVILAPGAQVFAAPTVEHQYAPDSPWLDGSRFRGYRAPSSDVVLPVHVLGDTWDEWRATDAAWFRATDPRGECALTVTAPDGESRTLRFRFVSGGDLPSNPLDNGYAAYTMEFTAASPYWEGDPVSVSFAPPTAVPMFPGPPFAINPRGVGFKQTVTNPGDIAVFPRYTINGPMSSWSAGVGESVVSSSTAMALGNSYRIDQDPRQLTIVNASGTRAYEDMTALEFAEIPPGQDVPLTVKMLGYSPASSIVVEFTPLYRRPL